MKKWHVIIYFTRCKTREYHVSSNGSVGAVMQAMAMLADFIHCKDDGNPIISLDSEDINKIECYEE